MRARIDVALKTLRGRIEAEHADDAHVKRLEMAKLSATMAAKLYFSPQVSSASHYCDRLISDQPIANLHHRVGEGLGLLLRQIMSRIDNAVLVRRNEHAGMLCGAAGLERVDGAIDRHRRHFYRGLLCQAVFEWLQRRVAGLKAKGGAIAVDHDIHEVRVGEGRCRSGECCFIKLPAGRPFAPQYPAQFTAVLIQAFATALGLEEMLIPEDALKRRFDRVPLLRNVDHVVARVRYESTNPLRP